MIIYKEIKLMNGIYSRTIVFALFFLMIRRPPRSTLFPYTTSSDLDSLKLTQDTQRLESRKSRSGQSRLRGRSKKVGKSVLFVTKDSSEVSKAIGALPGVEVKNVKDLSVLDLAPGSHPIRLTVYSKSAIEEIAKIKSTHLEVMVKTQ